MAPSLRSCPNKSGAPRTGDARDENRHARDRGRRRDGARRGRGSLVLDLSGGRREVRARGADYGALAVPADTAMALAVDPVGEDSTARYMDIGDIDPVRRLALIEDSVRGSGAAAAADYLDRMTSAKPRQSAQRRATEHKFITALPPPVHEDI